MLNFARTWELELGNMELLSALITLRAWAHNALLFSYTGFSRAVAASSLACL